MTLQGERRPGDDEAERADREGHPVAQDDPEGGCHRWNQPDREEDALLAVTLVASHEHAEREPRERQKEQQKPDDHEKSQQKIH